MDAPASIVIRGIDRALYKTIRNLFVSSEIVAEWPIQHNLYSMQLDYVDLRFEGVSGCLKLHSCLRPGVYIELQPSAYIDITIQ